jgi:hypothetical protein
MRQEDRQEGQDARGRNGEHTREKGRDNGDFDAHDGNRTIATQALQLTV